MQKSVLKFLFFENIDALVKMALFTALPLSIICAFFAFKSIKGNLLPKLLLSLFLVLLIAFIVVEIFFYAIVRS